MACSEPGCEYPTSARGLCAAHYKRWHLYGDPTVGGPIRRRGLSERDAFAHYMPGPPPADESCWDWTGYTDPNGYGRFGLNGTHIPAHVASHRIYNGPVPAGAMVLHSCDRPICVQPKHLHLGTNSDNMAERNARDRTARGQRSGNSKLTEADVQWIRAVGLSNADVARALSVDRSTVSAVRSRRTWTHI